MVIIAKILFVGQMQIQTARDVEPRLGQPRGARLRAERRGFPPTKPMGGTSCRPPIRRSKIGKSNLGVYLRLRSNSFYAKFLKKSNRSALPPTADYGGLPRRKTFFTIFDFARAQHFFLLKGKNFFVVFCSERAGGRAGSFFLLGRGIMGCRGKEGGKKILFRPACRRQAFCPIRAGGGGN